MRVFQLCFISSAPNQLSYQAIIVFFSRKMPWRTVRLLVRSAASVSQLILFRRTVDSDCRAVLRV